MKVSTFLEGRWERLTNVRRLATFKTHSDYSVAEHSWVTAMLCLMALDDMAEQYGFLENNDSSSKDFLAMRGNVLEKALVHDIEEAITGDIPNIDILNADAKPLKDEAVGNIRDYLFHGEENITIQMLREDCKVGVTGQLVAFFDLYALLIECIKDRKMGNNMLDDVIQRALELMNDISFSYYLRNKHGRKLVKCIADYMKNLSEETDKYIRVQWVVN